MIQELLEAGEIVKRGDMFFEDMGGHVIHESMLDDCVEDYFASYLKMLSTSERAEALKRVEDNS